MFTVYCDNHTEHTDTVRTSQETHYIFATKPKYLMLLLWDTHGTHRYTVWSECSILVCLSYYMYTATAGLWRCYVKPTLSVKRLKTNFIYCVFLVLKYFQILARKYRPIKLYICVQLVLFVFLFFSVTSNVLPMGSNQADGEHGRTQLLFAQTPDCVM
jgi:hypothetical protein